MSWEDATIAGFVNGKPAAQVNFVADPVANKLQVVADADRLGRTESLRLMVRALDQAGHKLPFFGEPVTIKVSGAGRLIGPDIVPLRAGSTGFWVQATGSGAISVSVSNDRLGTVVTELVAE
jgi:beta-galactosidase